MDLWIKSQDKMNLVKINQININYKNTCQIIANYIPDFIGKEGEYYETLGNYKSKERALEILDEIQKLISEDEYMHISQTKIYEMPKE